MLAYGFYFISEFLGFAETGVGLVCDLRHYRNYIVVQLFKHFNLRNNFFEGAERAAHGKAHNFIHSYPPLSSQ